MPSSASTAPSWSRSTAASSWSTGWTFTNGESVSSGWGGTYSQTGADVEVDNASWNGAIGSGGSVIDYAAMVMDGDGDVDQMAGAVTVAPD